MGSTAPWRSPRRRVSQQGLRNAQELQAVCTGRGLRAGPHCQSLSAPSGWLGSCPPQGAAQGWTLPTFIPSPLPVVISDLVGAGVGGARARTTVAMAMPAGAWGCYECYFSFVKIDKTTATSNDRGESEFPVGAARPSPVSEGSRAQACPPGPDHAPPLVSQGQLCPGVSWRPSVHGRHCSGPSWSRQPATGLA